MPWLRITLGAGVLALALACQPEREVAGPGDVSSAPPNVLLVVLDTTRDAAISAYSGPPAHTPNVDRLAREGVLFANSRATSSWTLPTHASLFTGQYPFQHGAHHETQKLASSAHTLAERLRGTHETAAFSENAHISRAKGFAQGFDIYQETWRVRNRGERRGTIERFHAWFRDRNRSRPFFAFVNLMSTHLPYSPPMRWQRRFLPPEAIASGAAKRLTAFGELEARQYMSGERELSLEEIGLLRKLYLADAAWTDERLGKLLAPLRRSGVLDDTLVIVVGDHGENIGEHGLIEHQFALYETLLRVPLVMRWPRHLPAHARREAAVQLVDVYPTVLDAAGVAPEEWGEGVGVSLLRGDPDPERPTLAEYMRPLRQRARFARAAPDFDFSRFDRRLKSIQLGPLKLIAGEDGSLELYDLGADPDERRNLAPERLDTAARMRERLLELTGGFEPRAAGAPPLLDAEARNQLRGLGYLEP